MRIAKLRMPILSKEADYTQRLVTEIDKSFEVVVKQLNGVSEGTADFFHNSATAAPTTGTFARGDFIKNKEPSELGSAASKYVILGWICTVAGTPGTWLPCRVLTGN